ncbi:MAG: hypothetical protein JNK82_42455 [Myxococcaceae bacterium]|nr:hypothetical protein [Myxococcaceae bacterium]
MTRGLVVLAFFAACSGTPVLPREVCGNGLDDDGNGKTDCEDVDCAGQATCPVPDAGTWGDCAKCGMACVKQQDCFGPQNFLDERPLPQCGPENKCMRFNKPVALRIEYDSSPWAGASGLGVITTRWVSKTGRDGGSVTCADVKAASTALDDPLQLEKGGRFTMYGVDVTRLGGAIPQPVIVPFAYTGVASDYMLFTETWAGNVDSVTRLPTGMRRPPTACVDMGATVAPVEVSQDCSLDAGAGTTCRTLRTLLPPPT